MRYAVPFARLALTFSLMCAAPAGAQSDLGLRDALPGPTQGETPQGASAAPPPSGFAANAPGPTPAPAPVLPATSDESGQCRASCARSYYFCLASERVDDCPAAWGQCRAACDARSLAPPG